MIPKRHCWRQWPSCRFPQLRYFTPKQEEIIAIENHDSVTMQLIVRRDLSMIAAPVHSDVD